MSDGIISVYTFNFLLRIKHGLMMSKIIIVLFHILLYSKLKSSKAQTWIKAGYWFSSIEFPISDINSVLFTHLICAFAGVNSSSYELSVSSSDEQRFSTFTNTVRQKNPSVNTLLSIADWRAAVNSEAKNSSQKDLILTASVLYSPNLDSVSFPMESIRSNLDWVHVNTYDYHAPGWSNYTGAHAALYDPSSQANTDYGIGAWIGRGLPASKLVLGLPSMAMRGH
ncbi:class V chitinase-like [Castanea sativa]|uniref:class V chitinase-like n=1 Tax=Castanea sativa TaxID=21020 RepID=UPI003F64F4F4